VTASDIKIHEIQTSPQHIPNMKNQENCLFLTIKEVSALLRMSVSTINLFIKKGDFPQKINLFKRMIFMKR